MLWTVATRLFFFYTAVLERYWHSYACKWWPSSILSTINEMNVLGGVNNSVAVHRVKPMMYKRIH